MTNPALTDFRPYSPRDEDVQLMTISGTIWATASLLVILVISAVFGWLATPPTVERMVNGKLEMDYSIPMFAIVFALIAFVVSLFLIRSPKLSRIIAPIYAVIQGVVIGSVSKAYESMQDGIVLQAVGATIAVFLVMLFLHAFRVFRVTPKFRKVVIGATIGVLVFYMASWVIMLLAGPSAVQFLSEPSAFNIGISVVIAVIAALNLSLDFDLIETLVEGRAEQVYEWYGAFALLITIVWLYLQMLRILGLAGRK